MNVLTISIVELFNITAAKSGGIKDYEPGDVPFVTSTEINNGVVSYVTPKLGDKVFKGPVVCVSALGFATVHFGTILPKGNGGDSITILTPRAGRCLSVAELISFASVFNHDHSWRFSFGRKCSVSRIEQLEVTFPLPVIDQHWQAEMLSLSNATKRIEDLIVSSE